jgi:hypothetical protein
MSKFSPAAPRVWADEEVLPSLTEAQCAYLLYAAAPSVVAISVDAFEAIERLRRRFYEVRESARLALQHGPTHRELLRCHAAIAGVIGVIEYQSPASEVIWRRIVTRANRDATAGHVLGLLPWLRELERAASFCVEAHRRPLVDQGTPFLGFVAEVAWIWSGLLKAEVAISNRPPVTSFSRFAFAVMRTLPAELRMHVDGVDPVDPDSWARFTQALYRAHRRTLDLQVESELGRRLAWALGGRGPRA